MKINELLQMNEGFSAETKKWVKAEINDKATFKGNSILIPMTEDEYNKGLAKLLTKLDLHCPENMRRSIEWGGTFKDGVATIYSD